MRLIGAAGNMASRPKTMGSIRRKLRESSVRLDQMNDLGGCRAIMNDIAGVRALLAAINTEFPHTVRQQYPYIDQPKSDGYRSHHVVFLYNPTKKENETFEGRRIELQIRTRLQHSWATAVEAVGLYRGQDLKHGKGDADWLRLFSLVSAEFAHAESCQVHDEMPSHIRRISEIKALNTKLKAAEMLENIKNATHFAENFVFERGKYFLIRYFPDHTVTVESYQSPIAMSADLGEIEVDIERSKDGSRAVLVEVDKVDKLIDTYPNYFGDVSLFVRNLRSICEGRAATEYSMIPQEIVSKKLSPVGDLNWLKRRYTKWNEKKK
jgi:ppGpp synthetase/RelA/SpoT-type nucleotidyltranferase